LNTLTIGKVAKSCNVNIETVRYYERLQLIPLANRSESGYRLFEPDVIKIIGFIKNAQELGLSLDEIKTLLTMSISEEADCGDIQEIALEKLEAVEQKLTKLKRMKRSLKKLIDACPGKGVPLKDCNIIDSFYR